MTRPDKSTAVAKPGFPLERLVGRAVTVIGGSDAARGRQGTVMGVCDNGCEVFVRIADLRNKTFGEWPINHLDLELTPTEMTETNAEGSNVGLSAGSGAERDPGWYWVRKEDLDGKYGDWTPALWKADRRAWYTWEFSGVPDSQMIVGERLRAPNGLDRVEIKS